MSVLLRTDSSYLHSLSVGFSYHISATKHVLASLTSATTLGSLEIFTWTP
jgi:hypothetical protein